MSVVELKDVNNMGAFIGLAFKNVFRQKKRSFTLGINYAVVAFILVLLLAFSR